MSRIIDAILRLKDDFTAPLSKSITAMTNCSKSAVKIGRDIDKTGQSISRLGMTLTTAVTLPAVALGVSGTKAFGEFDSSLRLIKSTMGEAKWATADMSEGIKKSASNSIFTVQQTTDAALNFARAGFDAKESVDMLTPSLNLASGTETDLATVTAGLGNTMKMFSSQQLSASRISDIYAKAQAQANTTTSDLLEAVSIAGPIFNTTKWTLEDLATTTDILGEAGISGSEGANALKTGLARLAAPASSGQKWIKKLNLELFNSDGTMKSFIDTQKQLHDAFATLNDKQKLQASSAIFGKEQMTKWLAVIDAAPERVSEFRNALDDCTGVAQDMSDALMGGSGGALKSLSSSFDVFKVNVGEALQNVVTPFVTRITNLIDKFNELQPAEREQAVRFAAMAAAIGPAITIFGKGVSVFGKGVQIFNKIGMAAKASGGLIKAATAAAASPCAIAIAAIAAIAAVIAIVVTHLDQFKAAASTVATACAPAVQSLMESFKQLYAAVAPIIGFIADLLANILTGAMSGAANSISIMITGIARLIGGIAKRIGGMVGLVTSILHGDWASAWEYAKQIVEGVMDSILGAVQAVSGAVGAVAGAIKGGIKSAADFVVGKASTGSSATGTVKQNAVGTSYWRGGVASINEHGGEIVDLPRGTRIYPHDESVEMARNERSGGGGVINIAKLADSIVVREEADIEKIAAAIVRKIKEATNNRGEWTYSGNMA